MEQLLAIVESVEGVLAPLLSGQVCSVCVSRWEEEDKDRDSLGEGAGLPELKHVLALTKPHGIALTKPHGIALTKPRSEPRRRRRCA